LGLNVSNTNNKEEDNEMIDPGTLEGAKGAAAKAAGSEQIAAKAGAKGPWLPRAEYLAKINAAKASTVCK
jgi:hypothetical protein